MAHDLPAVRNPQVWYEESQVMVKLQDSRFVYRDIRKQVNSYISKVGFIKYIMGKNPHWNESMFHMVDWTGMKACMGKLKETEATNVLKLVHGWQNDGQ